LSRKTLPAAGAALILAALLIMACLVHVPAGDLAVLAWRGGGTPTLLRPGFALRVPFLQRLYRYPQGEIRVEGVAEVSSREGSALRLPYSLRLKTPEQDLLDLQRQGGAAGAPGAVRLLVEEKLRRGATARGTYDLASGEALKPLEGIIQQILQERFGNRLILSLGQPELPPEVRASFEKAAIYNRRTDTGVRVLLVGLDGADWDFIDPMIARGELPTLAGLKARGVWARLRSSVPTLSPLLWTSVATGKSPDRHGINDFLVSDPRTGRRVPINSTFRRSGALWTILSGAGLSSDIIAWWATWPAEPILGYMISDRVAYSTFNLRSDSLTPGAVHPPDYAAVVERLRVEEGDIDYAQVARFARLSQAEFRAARARTRPDSSPSESQESINLLVRVLAATETYRRVAIDLIDRAEKDGHPPALFAVYFQGIDEINHRFAHCAPPRTPLCSAEDYRRFSDTVAAFYRYQDTIVGDIVRRDPEATILLLSDHGFASGPRRPDDVKPFIEGKPGLWHDLTGVFMARGKAIGKGEIPTVTLYDIAPTVLYLLGLPVPDDMQGHLLETAVAPAFLQEHPAVHVPSYEGIDPKEQESAQGEVLAGAADEEMVERLRSLGYVGGDAEAPTSPTAAVGAASAGAGQEGAPPAAGQSEAPAPTGEGVPTLLYHTNLGAVYLGKRQYDEAEVEFRKALQIDPQAPQALAGLSVLYEGRGDLERSLELLRYMVRLGLGDDMPTLTRIAEHFVRMGRAADGVVYMEGLAKRPMTGRGRIALGVARGILYAAVGRTAEAEKSLLGVLAADPLSIPAMQELFTLYDAQGRAAALEPHLREALRRDARSPMHHNWLGLVLKRRGDPAGAEAEFRKTIEYAPDLTGAVANLGSLYLQEGRAGEAVALLEHAIEQDPRNVEVRTNLIVALGMDRDIDAARGRLEEAVARGQRLPLFYNAMAYALHFNGHEEEALESLRQSLALDPKQADALQLRGEIERARAAGHGGGR